MTSVWCTNYSFCYHRKTCELLIAKGADVTTKERTNSTALHLAAKAGSLRTARALQNCLLPSTIDERDKDKNTPLHIASRYNRVDLVRFLLDKGADVTARNVRNMTCLDIAIEWEYEEIAKTLVRHPRSVKCVEIYMPVLGNSYMIVFLDLGTSNSFEQSIHETIIAAIEDLLAFSQFVVNFYFCLFTLHGCLKLQLPGELLSRDNDMKIDKDNLPLACTIVVEHTEPRKAWVGFLLSRI